ncbi:MAG TPA: ABC transporter permease [Nitrososphaera sp.]|jgi:peptide/nickel transport system permease protein
MSVTEVLSGSDIIRQFRRSKSGLAGILLLLSLILMSIYAAVAVPLESFRQWNNPVFWVDLPQSAAPAWTNIGFGPKSTEHVVLSMDDASISSSFEGGVRTVTHSYSLNYNYDTYPDDFMIIYAAKYGSTQPALQVEVQRPDGNEFRIYFASLPPSQQAENEFAARIFSTDRLLSNELRKYVSSFSYPQNFTRPQVMIFSDAEENRVLKGTYVVRETFYLFDPADSVLDSGFILGGKVYGIIGTDDLRRDLSVGILWGAPVALFIGLTVAIAGVIIGLVYGVVAGYKGNRTDEGLMRINDIFYSLPTLPLLIILSVTIGRSIFLITGFLVIFGWVGMAKISRSLALQIKNLQYVEAAKLMGQSDFKIISKHIIPQLLPLTFASIAISVPGAILGEASLSFLGLSDPSIPTWGQILHDANTAGAASRGLWWWIVPPGLMIALTGLAFVLIGNALDAIVNPRSRKR